MNIKAYFRKNHIKLKFHFNKSNDYFFGNKNYKKFVIVSDSRTGSTLLMQLLNSHPEIITLGEEFKNLDGKSCRKVWSDIFRKRQKDIHWVGFKLFYFHPWKSNDQEVWNFLKADKEIVIIHLIRRNILRSFVSKQIGLKTRKWTENVNRPHLLSGNDKKVKLNPKDCLENFESIDEYIQQTNSQFKEHKLISIVYEDLDADKQKEINRLYRELGVQEIQISTIMKRQNPENLEELIVNYWEVKSAFSGTKWEYLFYEESS